MLHLHRVLRESAPLEPGWFQAAELLASGRDVLMDGLLSATALAELDAAGGRGLILTDDATGLGLPLLEHAPRTAPIVAAPLHVLADPALPVALRHAGIRWLAVDGADRVLPWADDACSALALLPRLRAAYPVPVLLCAAPLIADTAAELALWHGDAVPLRAVVALPRIEVVRHARREHREEWLIEQCRSGSTVIVTADARAAARLLPIFRQARLAATADEHRVLVGPPAPATTIIHCCLPRHPEAYLRHIRPFQRAVIALTPQDGGNPHTDGLPFSVDDLRHLYAWLKRHAHGGWALMSPVFLARVLAPLPAVCLEQMLLLLERAGVLVRHGNAPAEAEVTVRALAPETELLEAAGCVLGQPCALSIAALAVAVNVSPAIIDAQLRQWAAAGLLVYRPQVAQVLIELPAAPADAPARISALLAELADANAIRSMAMLDVIRPQVCRSEALLLPSGGAATVCHCDTCAGSTARPAGKGNAAPTAPADTTEAAILAAIRELPGQLSDKELACVLLGMPGYPPCSVFGALAGSSIPVIRGSVNRLLDRKQVRLVRRVLVPAG